ncbi:hypothetical protein [Pedobacter cryophilus]|uniref:Uncharacterized protein n=1 Tax=Pedobacter cryophilus TaxID=2571271 RepID=A0A4U1C686_9SPHI|nr:hypothetical protein [Pedobacter cryophilus]TKC00882.1 hypothetical protein FA046_04180 [Pedobacter cryophilus]
MKNFINKNLLLLGGILMLFISCMAIWGNLVDYDIYRNGFEITANVIEAPENCDDISSRGGFCKLEYNGKIYVEKAGNKFCHLVSGKNKVKMLTNKNFSELIFPNEFNDFEFASGFLLLAFALFLIIKNFVKK